MPCPRPVDDDDVVAAAVAARTLTARREPDNEFPEAERRAPEIEVGVEAEVVLEVNVFRDSRTARAPAAAKVR